jgi:site-specific recombinase XerD
MFTTLPLAPDEIDLDLFLSPPHEALSIASKEAYKGDRAEYAAFCRENGLALGDTSSLEAFKEDLLSRSLKANTVNRKLAAVKSGLIGYLVSRQGKNKEEVFKQLYKCVHSVKKSHGDRQVRPESILTEEEIEALIAAADSKTARMIRFLALTGCRVSEMVNVKLADIEETSHGSKAIRIMGKGSKERTVYISEGDYQNIRETFDGKTFLFETIHGNRYSRENITKKLGDLSERILGKHVYSHLLRHSFATNMIRKTHKIQATSAYLGHSSVSTTLSMYTHEVLTLGDLGI